MTDLLVALDIGGTKSDGVLFTPDGEILRRVVTPGANPLELGLEEALRRYLHAVRTLTGEDVPRLRSLYAGVAAAMYFGDKITRGLQPHIAADHLRIEGDGPALISTMLGHQDGASLICGTGSSLTIRKGEEYDVIGGWGYLIDGCASGYILGRDALLAAVREHDGRGEKTLLSELLHARCGEPVAQHMETIYARGRAYIASFAGAVFEASAAGDPVAGQIISRCVGDLAELVATARRRLGGAYTLVLNGGIFRAFPEYSQALKAASPADVTFIDSDAPPILGCAVEAMWDAGFPCTEAFRRRFMEGYQALQG